MTELEFPSLEGGFSPELSKTIQKALDKVGKKKDGVEALCSKWHEKGVEVPVDGARSKKQIMAAMADHLAERLKLQLMEGCGIKVKEEATESDNPAEAAAAFFDLAGYRLAGEDFDGAIEAYEEALELAPRFSSNRLFSFADALIVLIPPHVAREAHAELLEAARASAAELTAASQLDFEAGDAPGPEFGESAGSVGAACRNLADIAEEHSLSLDCNAPPIVTGD